MLNWTSITAGFMCGNAIAPNRLLERIMSRDAVRPAPLRCCPASPTVLAGTAFGAKSERKYGHDLDTERNFDDFG
jgi:hypothetical protein